METTARIISSPALRFCGAGDDVRSSLKLPSRRLGIFRACFGEFSDSGHLKYYQSPIIRSENMQKEKIKVIETESKKMKKMKMKLIKRLSKDLNFFSQTVESQEFESRLMGEVKGKMMSEAAEVLLAQLESLRTEQKEQKRKRKEEKAKMMKSKSESSSSSSSSSSESSDSEDGGKPAIDMRILRNNNEAEQGRLGETSAAEPQTEHIDTVPSTSSFNNLQEISSMNEESVSESLSNTKIEICMGGKCKKLGAPMLLEEFEKKIGTEGSVVGCKCMGKCKSAPNVRVCNSVSEIQEESVKCSIQTPSNPLYIGVGLQDVGVIVANLLSQQNWDDNSVLAAA